MTTAARLVSINVSNGGVPKRPVSRCRIASTGLDGDRQKDRRHHGGPERAVTAFSLERIHALQAEGHPIETGTTGENLTLAGLDWASVGPGTVLRIGAVRLQVTKFAPPCETIRKSFEGGAFERISEKKHPGWSRVCFRVLHEGEVVVGAEVLIERPGGAPDST